MMGTAAKLFDGTRWHRLKVVFDPGNPAIPGEWFVLYFDTKTWLIGRVHARISATFLRQARCPAQ